mmetsp:Transcript_34689/g.54170  ORF Transcript_34689/g.54170 Transcript_34689/m.54170 type:complete len:152 (-) Transcript_34689:57-512(-)
MGYEIDIMLAYAEETGRNYTWAIEVDGPTHYLECMDGSRKQSGRTLLKHTHLKMLGYNLVVLPWFDWYHLMKAPNPKRKVVQYLRSMLGQPLSVDPGPVSTADEQPRPVPVSANEESRPVAASTMDDREPRPAAASDDEELRPVSASDDGV